MKYFTAFAAVCAALPYVTAHGFVSQVIIDGDAYEGNSPGENKGAQRGRRSSLTNLTPSLQAPVPFVLSPLSTQSRVQTTPISFAARLPRLRLSSRLPIPVARSPSSGLAEEASW